MNRKAELLFKVVAWRSFSMCYGFLIAYLFTENVGESAGIVFMTGSTLTLLQWFFEIVWDKHARTRIRHAFSGQQSRIGRLLRWRRGSRDVSLDKHESGSDGREEDTNPLSPQNAGREWT
jgi:uncharacterized membrane protein